MIGYVAAGVRDVLRLLQCLRGAALAAALVACGRSGLDDLDFPDAADASAVLMWPEASVPDAPNAPSPSAPDAPDPCAGKPPIPCPGGGDRYCVGGAYSECPARCSVCVPGSRRVCLLAYCNFWGTQTCASDGQAFGYCVEATAPAQCASIADQQHSSPALEQCCLDHGSCCQDTFDLNHNGDTQESIGQCSGVTCD
jgi:hypothetical protein